MPSKRVRTSPGGRHTGVPVTGIYPVGWPRPKSHWNLLRVPWRAEVLGFLRSLKIVLPHILATDTTACAPHGGREPEISHFVIDTRPCPGAMWGGCSWAREWGDAQTPGNIWERLWSCLSKQRGSGHKLLLLQDPCELSVPRLRTAPVYVKTRNA